MRGVGDATGNEEANYKNVNGVAYSCEIVEFGEVVMFKLSRVKISAGTKAKSAWRIGCWAGKLYETSGHVVGNACGCRFPRTVRQVPEESAGTSSA